MKKKLIGIVTLILLLCSSVLAANLSSKYIETLDLFLTRLETYQSNSNYVQILDSFITQLNVLKPRYSSSGNVPAMVDYLISGVEDLKNKKLATDIDDEFFKNISDLISNGLGGSTSSSSSGGSESTSTSSSSGGSTLYTYAWEAFAWGTCDKTCGGGTQTRTVICGRSDGGTVEAGYCTGTKPVTSQSCNTQACSTSTSSSSTSSSSTSSSGGSTSSSSGGSANIEYSWETERGLCWVAYNNTGYRNNYNYCVDSLGNKVDNSKCEKKEFPTETCEYYLEVDYSLQTCINGKAKVPYRCKKGGEIVDNSYCEWPPEIPSYDCNYEIKGNYLYPLKVGTSVFSYAFSKVKGDCPSGYSYMFEKSLLNDADLKTMGFYEIFSPTSGVSTLPVEGYKYLCASGGEFKLVGDIDLFSRSECDTNNAVVPIQVKNVSNRGCRLTTSIGNGVTTGGKTFYGAACINAKGKLFDYRPCYDKDIGTFEVLSSQDDKSKVDSDNGKRKIVVDNTDINGCVVVISSRSKCKALYVDTYNLRGEQTRVYSYISNGHGVGSCGSFPNFWSGASPNTKSCTFTATRSTNKCVRSDGVVIGDVYCPDKTSVPSYSWYISDWSSRGNCKVGTGTTPGTMTSTRTVYCKNSSGTQVSDSYCSSTTKPESSRTASYSTTICSNSSSTSSSTGSTTSSSSGGSTSYTYTWNPGTYGSCSKTCGGGTQTRTVNCKRSDGTIVADSYCSGTKPATSQSCNTTACSTTSSSGGSTSLTSVCTKGFTYQNQTETDYYFNTCDTSAKSKDIRSAYVAAGREPEYGGLVAWNGSPYTGEIIKCAIREGMTTEAESIKAKAKSLYNNSVCAKVCSTKEFNNGNASEVNYYFNSCNASAKEKEVRGIYQAAGREPDYEGLKTRATSIYVADILKCRIRKGMMGEPEPIKTKATNLFNSTTVCKLIK